VVFYSVPHVGGTQDLSKYFEWQCQQIAKDTTQLHILKNMKSFDLKMEQLSINFSKCICENINIYAFVEILPINHTHMIINTMVLNIKIYVYIYISSKSNNNFFYKSINA